MLRVGTAGWNISNEFKDSFPEKGSHLERYSRVFNCVEINSTFSKFHQAKTFTKWATLTPNDFEFSLKLHRSFTHDSDLNPSAIKLKTNLREMGHLGDKWKVLLLQFPVKLLFHERRMGRFYKILRNNFSAAIVVEPRNLSWVSKESQNLMREFHISKVIADPERCPTSLKRILSRGGVTYLRLHGAPDIYKSSYSLSYLNDLKTQISQFRHPWCIFDNTTFGKATGNALTILGKQV